MYTIILAGGFGTRLFPLSRSSYPKQFIPLFGEKSLFQKTVERALITSTPENIYVVTNSSHHFIVKDQLNVLNAGCNILEEPCGKNTLPALIYAVNVISQQEPNAKILVLPSDQYLEENSSYANAINSAEKLASEYLVTFGITPATPHTGYGYIKPGQKLVSGYLVDAFVEKPDQNTARQYLTDGYLWNAGIFCFSADIFLAECRKYVPEIINAFESNPVKTAYGQVPKISIDYGLLEKTNNIAVVPLQTKWSDLGSFDALYALKEKDEMGNAATKDYITPDGENNLVISDRLVATIGLSNISIIDSADALVVCPKDQSQRIGEITEILRNKGDERVENHTTVHRPWGSYTILQRGKTFMIKRLTVLPHKRLSLQYHHHRSEHWVVVSGMAEVTNGERTFFVQNGESTFVPAGVKHRLANPGAIPLEVIEVQNGEYLSEDDIIRCNDDYDRESRQS